MDMDYGRHRRGDPATSIDAANKLKVGPGRWRIYLAIKRAGTAGLNWDETHQRTQIPLDTVSPRFTELAEMGLIETRYNVVGELNTRVAVFSNNQQQLWFDKHPDKTESECRALDKIQWKAYSERVAAKRRGMTAEQLREIYLKVSKTPNVWQEMAKEINAFFKKKRKR